MRCYQSEQGEGGGGVVVMGEPLCVCVGRKAPPSPPFFSGKVVVFQEDFSSDFSGEPFGFPTPNDFLEFSF